MSEFRFFDHMAIQKRVPHRFSGCSRVGSCSPLQIFLVSDLPEKGIERSYTRLHAYTHGQKFTGRPLTDAVMAYRAIVHRNAQKPNVKGGRLGFSGPNIIPSNHSLILWPADREAT